MAKIPAPDPIPDFDDLLALDIVPAPDQPVPDQPEIPLPEARVEPVETAAARRIAELTAELAQPAPVVVPVEPVFVPSAALSADEQQIRDLEDLVARKHATEAEAAQVQYAPGVDGGGETILLHFLEDGVTLGGVVWYRGQEIEFVVGSEAHQQQFDRVGKSWLDLVGDPEAQYARWGKRMFAPGPWPGRPWGDTSNLKDPDEIAAAERAAIAENRRGRAAPLIR